MANWGRITTRGNVEDRRGFAPAVGGLSLTTVALLFLFTYLSGGNLGDVLQQLPTAQVQDQNYGTAEEFQGEDTYEVFASKVLGSNDEMWTGLMEQAGTEYTPPKLVLFRSATQSYCGTATSQVGPHYCPLDQTIYIDETFFDELTQRFGATGGDVAEAYVIAHEVGHHAQNELQIMNQVQEMQQSDPGRANDLSIRMELQADCFAGLWANSIKDAGVFEAGEIREAMDAAAAVGDDRIQEKVTGYINPESWTHGSSEQRQEWFGRGYESGQLEACNTFQ